MLTLPPEFPHCQHAERFNAAAAAAVAAPEVAAALLAPGAPHGGAMASYPTIEQLAAVAEVQSGSIWGLGVGKFLLVLDIFPGEVAGELCPIISQRGPRLCSQQGSPSPCPHNCVQAALRASHAAGSGLVTAGMLVEGIRQLEQRGSENVSAALAAADCQR